MCDCGSSFRCRMKVGDETQTVDASRLDFRTVRCTTPRWNRGGSGSMAVRLQYWKGGAWVTADETGELSSQLVPAVLAEQTNNHFFGGVSASGDTRFVLYHAGVKAAALCICRFSSLEFEAQNVVVTAHVFHSNVTCGQMQWPYEAQVVRVRLECDGSLVGASPVNTTVSVKILPYWGFRTPASGLASGGNNVTVEGGSFLALLDGSIHVPEYVCSFQHTGAAVTSAVAVSNNTHLTCEVPAWIKGAATVELHLLQNGAVVHRSNPFVDDLGTCSWQGVPCLACG